MESSRRISQRPGAHHWFHRSGLPKAFDQATRPLGNDGMYAVRRRHEESINLLLERDIKDGKERAADDVASILPEELSSYQITGRLGKGAFGTVFSAWSERHGHFALKAVEYEGMGGAVIESLRREMETIPSINHPNVLHYHWVYDDRVNDTAYLAMEWCPGTLLDELRRRKERGEPFRDEEVWRRLQETTRGLAFFHEKGLVHRDLKPGNTLPASNEYCPESIDISHVSAVPSLEKADGSPSDCEMA